ncbi:MAG: transglycosylase domain-containing protein [Methylotenera sp.]|nr:transglycosylase domain-containing protein [Oligoflexia bacterium]
MGRFIFGLSLISVTLVGFFAWQGWQYFRSEFPDVSVLKTQYPVVHYLGPKKPPRVTLSKSRPPSWVSLGQVSKVGIGAIVVSEDWAFYQHGGFDARQIKEAIKEDWEEGTFARGASTITQQVVRNVFLDKDKNLWRKLKELILAVRIEESVGKRKILESYLNIAEWGEGIYGINAATQFYFKKSPMELTAREGAFLAMLLPSPKRYSQSYRARHLTEYAQDTVSDILHKMTQARYLTEQDRDRELSSALVFEVRPNSEVPSLPVHESEMPINKAKTAL